LWTKYDPAKYASIDYFNKDPSYYWNFFKDLRYPILKKAEPNTAHLALAKLEKDGKLHHVITQNIDGLHQEAGQMNVIELHGNTRQIICVNCSTTYTMEKAYEKLEKELPPKCSCGGILRPDVVLFGEPLPSEAIENAIQVSRNCDVFLVMGSSLVVYPAAQLPVIAKQNGAALIIINIDPTPLDGIADIVINKKASEILSNLID